jgi:hypothetical protein
MVADQNGDLLAAGAGQPASPRFLISPVIQIGCHLAALCRFSDEARQSGQLQSSPSFVAAGTRGIWFFQPLLSPWQAYALQG